jgi:hypothetical protein
VNAHAWIRCEKCAATFSPCRKYRYTLERELSGEQSTVNFVMLNPSTAGEFKNDPTVSRCISYARRWEFGQLVVTNIFAYRATLPADMKAVADPVGPENNGFLVSVAMAADLVVCAWGEHGAHLDRGAHVLDLLRKLEKPIHALRLNAGGQPAHPLYLPGSLDPIPLEATA